MALALLMCLGQREGAVWCGLRLLEVPWNGLEVAFILFQLSFFLLSSSLSIFLLVIRRKPLQGAPGRCWDCFWDRNFPAERGFPLLFPIYRAVRLWALIRSDESQIADHTGSCQGVPALRPAGSILSRDQHLLQPKEAVWEPLSYPDVQTLGLARTCGMLPAGRACAAGGDVLCSACTGTSTSPIPTASCKMYTKNPTASALCSSLKDWLVPCPKLNERQHCRGTV